VGVTAKHSGRATVKEVNSALVNLQKKPLKKKERKKENTCMHRAISAIHAGHVRTRPESGPVRNGSCMHDLPNMCRCCALSGTSADSSRPGQA
jgi:hypothetical protein